MKTKRRRLGNPEAVAVGVKENKFDGGQVIVTRTGHDKPITEQPPALQRILRAMELIPDLRLKGIRTGGPADGRRQ